MLSNNGKHFQTLFLSKCYSINCVIIVIILILEVKILRSLEVTCLIQHFTTIQCQGQNSKTNQWSNKFGKCYRFSILMENHDELEHIKDSKKFFSNESSLGHFPGSSAVKNLPARHQFNPWSGNIPHTAEDLSPLYHNYRVCALEHKN